MSGRLDGEVALVTGSTSGIGRAVAIRFAQEGAAVTVTGRSQDRGTEVASRIERAGGDVLFRPADLSEEGAAESLVAATVERFGSLTVLVNNAVATDGSSDGSVTALEREAWERSLQVNLSAPVWLCRAAIPAMVAAGHGAIVNISSRAAERGTPGVAAYTAAKGGLNALTRSIAVDHARHGIRCNTISAGYILNDRRDRDLSPERRVRLEGMHLTRLGEADDVASAAVYLASSEAGFVTGINLPVDGGSTAARGLTLG